MKVRIGRRNFEIDPVSKMEHTTYYNKDNKSSYTITETPMGRTKTVYTYDEIGRLVKSTVFKDDRKIHKNDSSYVTLMTYDEKDRLTSITERSPDKNEVTVLKSFEYDVKTLANDTEHIVRELIEDNLVQETIYNDAHDNPVGVILYKDDNGDVEQSWRYSIMNVIDGHRKVIVNSRSIDGTGNYHVEYVYNEKYDAYLAESKTDYEDYAHTIVKSSTKFDWDDSKSEARIKFITYEDKDKEGKIHNAARIYSYENDKELFPTKITFIENGIENEVFNREFKVIDTEIGKLIICKSLIGVDIFEYSAMKNNIFEDLYFYRDTPQFINRIRMSTNPFQIHIVRKNFEYLESSNSRRLTYFVGDSEYNIQSNRIALPAKNPNLPDITTTINIKKKNRVEKATCNKVNYDNTYTIYDNEKMVNEIFDFLIFSAKQSNVVKVLKATNFNELFDIN